jgi:hypothetical protein
MESLVKDRHNHVDVILERGVIVTNRHVTITVTTSTSTSTDATMSNTATHRFPTANLHLCNTRTSSTDVPVFQIILPTFPLPNVDRYAWVINFPFNNSAIRTRDCLLLQFPDDDHLTLAYVGCIIGVHPQAFHHLLHIPGFNLTQPVGVPRFDNCLPPPGLTTLQFLAYAQRATESIDDASRASTEAAHGHVAWAD